MDVVRSMVRDMVLKLIDEDAKFCKLSSELNGLGIDIDLNSGSYNMLTHMTDPYETLIDLVDSIKKEYEWKEQSIETLVDLVLNHYGILEVSK